MSAWKPGDVAAVNDVTRPNAPWLAATCIAAAKPGVREAEWMLHRSGVRVWGSVGEARPLVVIDAEDPEQADRLYAAYVKAADVFDNKFGHHMQAALRSLLPNSTPPKPTDPRARVTDRRENIWRLLADGDWVCTSGPDIGEYIVWWQLAERGPLSVEGVTS